MKRRDLFQNGRHYMERCSAWRNVNIFMFPDINETWLDDERSKETHFLPQRRRNLELRLPLVKPGGSRRGPSTSVTGKLPL